MIDVFERWNMPQKEADEWRRRSAVAFPELKSDKLRTTPGVYPDSCRRRRPPRIPNPGTPMALGLALIGSQYLVLLVSNPTTNLFPFPLVIFAILAVPCVCFAYGGKFLRSWLERRRRATGVGA
jgi:hypothetical protein